MSCLGAKLATPAVMICPCLKPDAAKAEKNSSASLAAPWDLRARPNLRNHASSRARYDRRPGDLCAAVEAWALPA